MRTSIRFAAAFMAAFVLQACASRVDAYQGSSSKEPDPDEVAVLAAALADVHQAFPFGKVFVDRSVADGSKRLAPPFMSARQHKMPELWAKGVQIELVQTEMTQSQCLRGAVDCGLPVGVAGTMAFSEPVIHGDSATVVTRYSMQTGVNMGHVGTTVERLTLRRIQGDWKITDRRITAKS